MTEVRADQQSFARAWSWLHLVLATLVFVLAVALVHLHLWPNQVGWDFDGDGVVTISDLSAWIGAVGAFPAHRLWLDATPGLAAFLGMDRHGPDGATFYFGLLDWGIFALLAGANGPPSEDDDDF